MTTRWHDVQLESDVAKAAMILETNDLDLGIGPFENRPRTRFVYSPSYDYRKVEVLDEGIRFCRQ